MTWERLKPIRFAEGAPNFIRNRKQRCFILDRPFRSHARGPSSRAAAEKNLASSFFLRQSIPVSKHVAHVFVSDDKLLEEFGDEIASHRCPISSRRANIVDGSDFF